MRAKQSILGLVYTGGEVRRPPLVGMQFLHERQIPGSKAHASHSRQRGVRRCFSRAKNAKNRSVMNKLEDRG